MKLLVKMIKDKMLIGKQKNLCVNFAVVDIVVVVAVQTRINEYFSTKLQNV